MIKNLSFTIIPRPPFRLDLTVWALRREPANRLERWDGTTYRRTLALGKSIFEITVKQGSGIDNPSLEVDISPTEGISGLQKAVTEALTRLLGLEVDLSAFYRFAAEHKKLQILVQRFRGVKPPRFLTLFETLANGIVFQQISLPAGMAILNHLIEAYGPAIEGKTSHAFPVYETIAAAQVEDLRKLGISRQKSRALIELVSSMANGLDLEQTEKMSDKEVLEFLYQLRGVGRWTSQYFLLRGLGRIHVFPGDDVGARNKVKSWLGLEKVPDYTEMQNLSENWHPYGGMVYFHLLLNHLAEKGYLQ